MGTSQETKLHDEVRESLELSERYVKNAALQEKEALDDSSVPSGQDEAPPTTQLYRQQTSSTGFGNQPPGAVYVEGGGRRRRPRGVPEERTLETTSTSGNNRRNDEMYLLVRMWCPQKKKAPRFSLLQHQIHGGGVTNGG